MERAVESARPLIDGRRHTLTVDVPDEPIWLHADPTRLEQVVVNLLNNAAKYTDEGGRIWLSARKAGHEMVLRVRDTGVGIDLGSSPTSSTCSRRRTGRWTARKGGWASGCPWCNGSWRCTGGRWRSAARAWGEGTSSPSASRCRPGRLEPPPAAGKAAAHPATPGECWWSMTTWTRPRSWRNC